MPSKIWYLLGVTALVVSTVTGGIAWLATTTPADTAAESAPRDVAPTDRVARLHEHDVSGENVTVGVIDVTGFDTDASPLRSRVAGAEAFGTNSVETGVSNHGTAATTVVVQTAPDATLYLANIGGIEGYVAAVRWLRQRDVDIIIAPVSFYGQQGNGRGPVGNATAAARDDGIVFVAPSGNLGASHWQGEYEADTVDNGTVTFTNDSRRVAIGGPTQVTVWLSWDTAHSDEEYTLELYRTDVEGERLVARSQPYSADDVPNERIVADVSPGRYALVLRGPDEPTGADLRLSSPTHEFEYAVAEGSILAPGTAKGALTVGAYNKRTGAVDRISSRGPTADGRIGVDVVAPNRQFGQLTDAGFVGSSASVPYVGGVVALMLDADPSLSPTQTELLVERTATDINHRGIDNASGHGLINATAAVQAAGNDTRQVG